MATAVFDQLYPRQAYGLKTHFRQDYGLNAAEVIGLAPEKKGLKYPPGAKLWFKPGKNIP